MLELAEATLKRISQTLNAIILLDPEFIAELKVLDGHTIRIIVLGLDLKLDLFPYLQGIDLRLADESQLAEVTVSGPPLSLLSLLISENKLQKGFGSDVQVAGDAQLARTLSEVIAKLDIDWEEVLARQIGDIPAHQIGKWFRSVSSWRKRLHESWETAAGEYLQEEARHLPTRIETEHFMDEVDSLSDAVERLQARLCNAKR